MHTSIHYPISTHPEVYMRRHARPTQTHPEVNQLGTKATRPKAGAKSGPKQGALSYLHTYARTNNQVHYSFQTNPEVERGQRAKSRRAFWRVCVCGIVFQHTQTATARFGWVFCCVCWGLVSGGGVNLTSETTFVWFQQQIDGTRG